MAKAQSANGGAANGAEIERIAGLHNVPVVKIGSTGGNALRIANRGAQLIDAPVATVKQRWSNALEEMLHA